MSDEKRKQLRLTALLVVLICLFTFGGFWFRGHPLFTGQGLRIGSNAAKPVATYEPYQSSFSSAFGSLVSGLTGQGAVEAAPAAAMSRFYTTKRAAVFTFSGLGSERELQSVLDALARTGSRATFFVTAEDLERRSDQVDTIHSAGQRLGICIPPADGRSAAQLLEAMRAQAETLYERYQITYEIFVRPSYGSGSDALLQAAAAGGFRVLTQLKEAVPESVSRMTDADEVLAAVFKENEGKLQRGEIVHFQMGLFQHSDTVLGELVEKLAVEKSCYPILSADEVAADAGAVYTYPLPDSQILPAVKNKIYPGHLDGMSQAEIFEVIRKGYLGISWVTSQYFLPGFSEAEIRRLDKRGVIQNDQNYVFRTFDDWGTDGTVDELLSVLKKHNATATFFVRTQYVPNNPNLLRAIAGAGHTIGAHTHMHATISNELSSTHFAELDEEQRKALEEDLVLCYDTMQGIIGDMTDADGKPSLSLLFRPPTLAVGKNGLQTVFDCGFTHAVSGYYTSTDYKAANAKTLAAELKKNIVPGAVIVMHFSDSAKYTPAALDLLLTEYENSGKNYRFVGLNKVY